MDYEVVLKLVGDAESILESNPPGNNPDAIRELKTLAKALLVASGQDGVIGQKCSSLISFAEIAYALRRRQSYSRERAARFAAADLYAMRIHAQQHQQAQSPPTTKRRDRGHQP